MYEKGNTHQIGEEFQSCMVTNSKPSNRMQANYGASRKDFTHPTTLRIVQTPRNGSWLNMAEIELSVLSRQCLNRRFDSAAEMEQEINAWQTERNEKSYGANWQFTTKDARIKLKSLYPIQCDN